VLVLPSLFDRRDGVTDAMVEYVIIDIIFPARRVFRQAGGDVITSIC